MVDHGLLWGILLLVLLFGGLAARFVQLQREQPPPRPSRDEDDEIDAAIQRWDRLQTKRGRTIWWE